MPPSVLRCLLMSILLAPGALAAQEVEAPRVFLSGIPFPVTVKAPQALQPQSVTLLLGDGTLVADTMVPAVGEVVVRHVVIQDRDQLPLRVVVGDAVVEELTRPVIPGWFSILPPLVAIGLALIFHEVITSLLAGVWLGGLFVSGYNPVTATMVTVDTFVRSALADSDHAAIVIFSLLLGGMVGLMSRMGGTRAIVEAVTPLATTRRRGLVATWLAGLAIFFDDYANTLIVGNTMRPMTDRLKVSREKLAYIVDSTAAPVAVLVFVSTWVGFEIGLIGDGLRLAASQMTDVAAAQGLREASPFTVFLHTIPYLFYPILAIAFVGFTVVLKRDFGPMLAAERRAVSGGGLFRPGAQLAADTSTELAEAPEGTPLRWYNGAFPVLAVVLTVVIGLLYSGMVALDQGTPRTLSNILGAADPFNSLLWGSFVGCLVGVALALGQRILTLSESITALMGGIRAMMMAMIILTLAWSLGEVTNAVGTAPYISSALSDTLPPFLLPVLTFIIAAAIAFSTGTSWATMAILFPIVIPLTVAMGGGINFDGGAHYTILLGGISSVMAGSIFGDHCSPISDTTVLSSMASGCDHVDHVRTQLPYALVVGFIGMLVGDIPTALGLSPFISLALGLLLVWAVVRFVGKPVEEAGA